MLAIWWKYERDRPTLHSKFVVQSYPLPFSAGFSPGQYPHLKIDDLKVILIEGNQDCVDVRAVGFPHGCAFLTLRTDTE